MTNETVTPDWTKEDLEKCAKSDKLVSEGKMTYRTVESTNERILSSNDFSLNTDYPRKFGLTIMVEDVEKYAALKNQILWYQAFHNDITKNYIRCLEELIKCDEKTSTIEQIITDIQMIECGDFFGEE